MITKTDLLENGFNPYFDENENDWTIDFDRVMFDLKEQILYDFCEYTGKKVKLSTIRDVEELKEIVYLYFKI